MMNIVLILLWMPLQALGEERNTIDFDQLTCARFRIENCERQGVPYTGKALVYYDDGQKKWELTYKEGKRHGTWTIWYPTGQPKVPI